MKNKLTSASYCYYYVIDKDTNRMEIIAEPQLKGKENVNIVGYDYLIKVLADDISNTISCLSCKKWKLNFEKTSLGARDSK